LTSAAKPARSEPIAERGRPGMLRHIEPYFVEQRDGANGKAELHHRPIDVGGPAYEQQMGRLTFKAGPRNGSPRSPACLDDDRRFAHAASEGHSDGRKTDHRARILATGENSS
jgi:hypothetical protein